MNELNRFLKVLNKVGYPNPDVKSIAKMVDFNLHNFLPNLHEEIGINKTNEFIKKSLDKLSEGKKGIRLDVEVDEYVYFKILDVVYNEHELENGIIIDWEFGDSSILSSDDEGNETHKTIQQIGDDVGMGEWSEYDEMINYLKDEISAKIFNNCGFYSFLS